jgi:hypothetical protein
MPLILNRNIYFENDALVLSHDEEYESGKFRHVKIVFDSESNKMTRFIDGELDLKWTGDDNVLHIPEHRFCPLCGALKGGDFNED